jgi:hypothetical protein
MSDALAEFVAMFANMPASEKAAYDELLRPELEAKWLALPGPQESARSSKADLLLYGGAAGGGKTDLVIGLALTEHQRSVIFRRAFVDLRGVEERLLEIRGTRAGYNASDMVLRTEDGRLIEFGALEKPGAEMSWQGRPHDLICVGRGTPVLMGDGSLKPVQDIREGDLVETLEGPRRVTTVHPTQHKPAVEVIAFCDGVEVGRQIQSANHELLTSEGWERLDNGASLRPSGSCEPIGCREAGTVSEWSLRTSSAALPSLAARTSDLLRGIALPLAKRLVGFSGSSASLFALGQVGAGSDCGAFGGQRQGGSQLPLSFGQEAPRKPSLLLAEIDAAQPVAEHEGSDAPKTSSLEGWTDRCSSGIRLCGGRIRGWLGLRAGSAGAQSCPRQRGDAGQHSPMHSLGDGRGRVRTRSRRIERYAHPYTKETRQAQAAARVRAASFSVQLVGEREVFDLCVEGANHYITKGGFLNKNCFDEGAQLLETKVRFVMGWLRSAKEGQRTRVVIASNPPIGAEGGWLVSWFAPWLDPMHPKPAVNGELRWSVTLADGSIRWVDGPGQWVIVGNDEAEATEADIEAGLALEATSRTFIPARLDDNPYLRGTGYRSKLQGLPEPLRSQLLKGDFLAGKEDASNQVIPTAWIEQAQARWSRGKGNQSRMLALGVDVAQGGADETVLAPLYGSWFDNLIKRKGVDTKNGPDVAALVIATMRDRCNVNIDLTGGWGGSARDHLQAQGINVDGVVFSAGSNGRTKDAVLTYANMRTDLWWSFREALDPESGEDVALPPDRRLAAQLAAPTWKLRGEAILIESKDEIRKRLGSSTDDADAVILAWHRRERISYNYKPKERRDIA